MTPIRISRRSVSTITSLFLILALGIYVLPATPANAFDEFLPRMDVQQKPVDGDPDLPDDVTGDRGTWSEWLSPRDLVICFSVIAEALHVTP